MRGARRKCMYEGDHSACAAPVAVAAARPSSWITEQQWNSVARQKQTEEVGLQCVYTLGGRVYGG